MDEKKEEKEKEHLYQPSTMKERDHNDETSRCGNIIA